jgi:biopolymer transport protein ExbD
MAFGSGLDRDDDVIGEINMVPLIDVMLVLLVIFIVTVPVLTHSVKLDLPRADARQTGADTVPVTVSVTADGGVFWNDVRVDAVDLESRLRDAAKRDPQPEVRVRGDRAVAYERVAVVMAAVQRSGITRIALILEPGP